jgi:glycosyltransferase involved in cell wall biosynthesis
MFKLNLITPCSRPKNLDEVYKSILPGLKFFNINWYIIFDGNEIKWDKDLSWIHKFTYYDPKSVSGYSQRNFALDKISSGYVYFLDDDTVIHPDFFQKMYNLVTALSKKKFGFIFGQQGVNWVRRNTAKNIKQCQIDMGQFVLDRELIGDRRFNLIYTDDGRFIEDLYNEFPNKFYIVPDAMSYYNWLRK